MTKKAPKNDTKSKSGIQVNRNRGGGKKKPDLFARLRDTGHPLDNIIPIELEFQTGESPDGDSLPLKSAEILPSTHSEELPSTPLESGRPHLQMFAVHTNESMPSTIKNVDVLPSTDPILPSTNVGKNRDVDVLPSTSKLTAVHKTKSVPSTKSDRHNKDLARYDNRIDPQIKKKIDVFCAESGLSQREFAEQSAVHFIDVWTAKLSKNVDGKTAHDDLSKMIMGRTSLSIINLYRAYNPENKWKYKDDESGVQFNSIDVRIIELGIIETQFNSKFKKINSFTYYENEIRNFMEQNLGEQMLDFLISHYRSKWSAATGRQVDLNFLKNQSEKK
jgi:hypothetical protein